MTAELDSLIEALRAELIEFGEALALLEAQRECIVQRSTSDLLANLREISRQIGRLLKAREIRNECRARLGRATAQPPHLTLSQISSLAPPPYPLLLAALADQLGEALKRFGDRLSENNRLIRSAQAREGGAFALTLPPLAFEPDPFLADPSVVSVITPDLSEAESSDRLVS